MHDCGKVQGNGIMTPEAILQRRDSSLRPCTSQKKATASASGTKDQINFKHHTGHGFLQLQQDITSIVP